MPQSVSIGLGTILDSAGGVQAPLTSANTSVVSTAFRLHLAVSTSVQILTDGGAVVNWAFQVSNLPAAFGRAYNQKILGTIVTRDDSAASNMWSTVASGTLPKSVGVVQGTISTLGISAHLDGRVVLTWDASNTGGSTAQYFADCRVSGT